MCDNNTLELPQNLINSIDVGNIVPIIGKEASVIRVKKNFFKESIDESRNATEQVKTLALDHIDKLNQSELDHWYKISLDDYFSIRIMLEYDIEASIDQLEPEYLFNLTKVEIDENSFKTFLLTLYQKIPDDRNIEIVLTNLKKLAAIANLKFYFNSSINNYLERAFSSFNPVQEFEEFTLVFPGTNTTKINKLNEYVETWENEMNGDDEDQARGAFIFNLFGRIANHKSFATTGHSYIEYLRHLDNQYFNDSSPSSMPSILNNVDYVFIGHAFRNWCMRFFIREFCGDYESSQPNFFLVGEQVRNDKDLTYFLTKYKKNIIKINGQSQMTDSFISRLYEYYKEKGETHAIYKRKAFISYRHVNYDKEIAELLNELLSKMGVEVWFDQTHLEDLGPEDNVDREILTQIDIETVFIAVLSRDTLEENDRYVRDEWAVARREVHEDQIFFLSIDGVAQPNQGLHPEVKLDSLKIDGDDNSDRKLLERFIRKYLEDDLVG